LILDKGFKLFSFQLPDLKSPALLFIVTTSLCQDWVIYATDFTLFIQVVSALGTVHELFSIKVKRIELMFFVRVFVVKKFA